MNFFRRVEQKYVLSKDEYLKLIDVIKGRINKDKYYKSTICNLYFDTDNNDLIVNSLEKPLFKRKVRLRSYNVPNINDDVFLESLKEKGVYNILSFGPALIDDGNISVSENEEVGKAMASNPRTAIGIIDDGHYVFVVSDGRTSESEGLSLYELANFMDSLGCTSAYNLDGGGSSTMYFNGKVINNPSNRGGVERSVSDIVYIGY